MRLFLASFMFIFIYVSGVLAHPHVWVYTDVKTYLENDKISHIHVRWNFDEMYSSALIVDSDTNANGVLEDSEVYSLYLDTLANVSGVEGFMYFQFGGEKVSPEEFKNFTAKIEDDDSLTYEFDVVFEKEISASGENFIGFFDPTQYISFEQGLTMEVLGDASASCTTDLKPAEFITLSLGYVHPELYTLKCEGV